MKSIQQRLLEAREKIWDEDIRQVLEKAVDEINEMQSVIDIMQLYIGPREEEFLASLNFKQREIYLMYNEGTNLLDEWS